MANHVRFLDERVHVVDLRIERLNLSCFLLSAVACFIATLWIISPSAAAASTSGVDRQSVPVGNEIAGTGLEYSVGPDDTASTIAARFGEPEITVLVENGDPRPGTTINIDNRHVALSIYDGVVINVAQRMLFLFREGKLAGAWPATVGRPDWQTPLGSFRVATLARNPTWHVPPAIRAEMEDEGIPVEAEVKPGARNPLGKLWIGLDHGGIGIHGTNHPGSIFRFGSHGCIRLAPESATDLFRTISRSELVEIIYEPVSLAVLEDGRIYMESDSDPYRLGHADITALYEAARGAGVEKSIDWAQASRALVLVEGIARRIDRRGSAVDGGVRGQP